MSKSEDERRARLAAALKQNISRRKAQNRAREVGDMKKDVNVNEAVQISKSVGTEPDGLEN